MYMYCCFVTHAVIEGCRFIVGAILLGNQAPRLFQLATNHGSIHQMFT